MTMDDTPDAAVQIVLGVVRDVDEAHAAVDALADAGWLTNPAGVARLRELFDARTADHDAVVAERDALAEQVAALRAVADAAREFDEADDPYGEVREGVTHMDVLHDALAALPPTDSAVVARLRALRADTNSEALRRVVAVHQPERVTVFGGGDCGRGFGEPGSGCCGACDRDVETIVCTCGAGLDLMPCPTLVAIAGALGVALDEDAGGSALPALLTARLAAL